MLPHLHSTRGLARKQQHCFASYTSTPPASIPSPAQLPGARPELHRQRAAAAQASSSGARRRSSTAAAASPPQELSTGSKARLAVFVSGGGSNFKAIHAACQDGRINAEVAVSGWSSRGAGLQAST